MNLRTAITLLAGFPLIAPAVFAQPHEIVLEPPRYSSEYVYAEVTRVSPVFEYLKRTRGVRECWDEAVQYSGHYSQNAIGTTLVGGVVGAAIGHQIGDGRGRDFSTALGTIVGARMGHDAAYSDFEGVPQYQRVCGTVQQDNGFEVIQDGYQISYRYAGKDYHARLPYDPGERIKLRVQVKEPSYLVGVVERLRVWALIGWILIPEQYSP